ncbi:hypothetical protein HanRHA438_Chr14g0648551 [Helianthus annuus]|nr:hypothetical protein HanHA300_Chr14g0519651 [Helianthus annuus]KAJ0659526.1 hypothetical protein HanOQP8_Chr14g0527101 [Helianthus annuus]KAJ0853211.1 hypothetical protein HanRHA438_Chr14g0648551 [Helianthus annuus]
MKAEDMRLEIFWTIWSFEGQLLAGELDVTSFSAFSTTTGDYTKKYELESKFPACCSSFITKGFGGDWFMLAVFKKEKCEMIQFTHYRANDGRRKRRAKMEGPHGCNLKGKKKEI